MSSPAFSLLAASPEDLRREALPMALAKALGITSIDAGMILRKSRGILREGLSRAEADRMAALLGDSGVRTLVVEDAEVAALPAARSLVRLDLEPDGLVVQFRNGGKETVPWSRIVLVAVGIWQETTRVVESRREEGPSAGAMFAGAGIGLATGLPIDFGEGPETPAKAVTRTELRLLLDLHLQDPGDRLRVEGTRFDYSGLGDAMALTALANLKALAQVLATALPTAARTSGTDVLLAGGRLSSIGYEVEEDFLREQKWWRVLRS